MNLNPNFGRAFEALIDWMLQYFGWLFDAITVALRTITKLMDVVLIGLHPILLIVVFTALAFFVTRRIGMAIFSLLAFGLIYISDLWVPTMQSLSIVLVSVIIALLIGIPLGIWASQSETVSRIVRPVLDVMQAMPVFVYLIPAVFFFGVGTVPGIVATIVFAIPPAVRLTELGIRQVEPELVEAATAFGAKRGTILKDVQLPLAFPSIMAGVNQVIMLALSMAVVAGMVGAAGLGGVVVEGVAQLNAAKGFEGGVAVVILAIYLDRVTGAATSVSEWRRNRRVAKGQKWNQEALAKAEAESGANADAGAEAEAELAAGQGSASSGATAAR